MVLRDSVPTEERRGGYARPRAGLLSAGVSTHAASREQHANPISYRTPQLEAASTTWTIASQIVVISSSVVM